MKTNSYNLFYSSEPSTILYHAIALSESRVSELADENGIDISGLEIELDRENVTDELHKSLAESIKDALVH